MSFKTFGLSVLQVRKGCQTSGKHEYMNFLVYPHLRSTKLFFFVKKLTYTFEKTSWQLQTPQPQFIRIKRSSSKQSPNSSLRWKFCKSKQSKMILTSSPSLTSSHLTIITSLQSQSNSIKEHLNPFQNQKPHQHYLANHPSPPSEPQEKTSKSTSTNPTGQETRPTKTCAQ